VLKIAKRFLVKWVCGFVDGLKTRLCTRKKPGGIRSVIQLFCILVCMPALSMAGYAVAENNDASVIYSGSNYTPTPKFISQNKALETQAQTAALIRIAYPLSKGEDLSLDQLPASEYYYYNTYTNTIAVASNSQDAIDLSQLKPKVFYAVAGQTLSDTLARWAKNNGMQLKYMLEDDYVIQYPYTFYGELTAKSGPLNTLLQSFADTQNAMKATVTKNHVIVITPNTYVPSRIIGV